MSSSIFRPVVFCGPSGSGKSTLINKLMQDFPEQFCFSVSHTTRTPRPGEIDGVHYHFTSLGDIVKAIKEKKFLEYSTYGGNIYGTSATSVETVLKMDKVCILDLDVQGVKQIKKSSLNSWYIFIKPPSIQELERRLKARNTETDKSLDTRMKSAKQELVYGTTAGTFDLVINNDNLEEAYSELKAFVIENVLKHECPK